MCYVCVVANVLGTCGCQCAMCMWLPMCYVHVAANVICACGCQCVMLLPMCDLVDNRYICVAPVTIVLSMCVCV